MAVKKILTYVSILFHLKWEVSKVSEIQPQYCVGVFFLYKNITSIFKNKNNNFVYFIWQNIPREKKNSLEISLTNFF